MMIVDRGSSQELGQYTRDGYNCVAQSIYASILYTQINPKTRKKIEALGNSAQKAGTIKSLTNVDLSKLLRVAQTHEGVGQTSIRRSVPIAGDQSRNIQVWTLETPDGRFYVTERPNPNDIHIVVAHGHAYACIPRQEIDESSRAPRDCPHKCWERYQGSRAQLVHNLANYCSSRDGDIPFYCPKSQKVVASTMTNLGMIRSHPQRKDRTF